MDWWLRRLRIVEDIVRTTARTLRDALARIARLEANIQQIPTGGGGGGGSAMAVGVVSTAIPTGTPAGPSTSGAVQIYIDGAASGDPVAVRNVHTLTASIAVGKAVQIARINGDWHVISADCP